jgi:hypothetical protein
MSLTQEQIEKLESLPGWKFFCNPNFDKLEPLIEQCTFEELTQVWAFGDANPKADIQVYVDYITKLWGKRPK